MFFQFIRESGAVLPVFQQPHPPVVRARVLCEHRSAAMVGPVGHPAMARYPRHVCIDHTQGPGMCEKHYRKYILCMYIFIIYLYICRRHHN